MIRPRRDDLEKLEIRDRDVMVAVVLKRGFLAVVEAIDALSERLRDELPRAGQAEV